MKKLFLFAAALLTCSQSLSAQNDVIYPGGKAPETQTVNNLWMWSDVPDPDIIRVGDFYYLVSTTMHLMPGAPVMRSRDLVTWETVSYLFDEIHDTPRYDMETPEMAEAAADGTNDGGIGFGEGNMALGTVYGRGQWATSIRYFNGTFWALHSANDAPHKSWLYKTDDPAKGWTLHARLPHYHDASLLFDDKDGRCYIYHDGGDVHLSRLNEELTAPDPTWEIKTLNTREGMPMGLLEGSRAFKHDGMYYLSMIAWPQSGRCQLAYRSKNIEGPYEMKVILKSKFGGWNYVGQGTVVDGKNGEWYGVIFQDRDGVGRALTLNPCNWIDGWPMIGTLEEGKVPDSMTLRTEEPTPARELERLSTVTKDGYISIVKSDEFGAESTMNSNVPLWQWNHNPVKEAWSMTERPGYLRLRTSIPAKSLYHARNTLTQRMEGPTCAGAISMDISKMKDGDRAGFAAFNGHSGILTIEKNGGKAELVLTHEVVELTNQEHAIKEVQREEIARVNLGGKKNVCLKITGDFRPGKNDNATFWYSLDGGKNYKQLGGDYQMRFDYRKFFMGTKFSIFNYCTKKAGGYVDVDWFHYEH